MNTPSNAALAATATLVLKQGVSLGLLDAASRQRALAMAWRCLPQDAALSEKQVNRTLLGFVDQAGAFLRTDHVELRRWLVDDGWLLRDGFGREYRAASVEALPAACREAALPLSAVDVNDWAQGVREQARADARRRRLAWEERQRAASVTAGQAAAREP